MTAPAPPETDDAPPAPPPADSDRAYRRARWLAVAPGLIAVVAGLVLLGFGFGDWGSPRWETAGAGHLFARVVSALALGVIGLVAAVRAGTLGEFERVHVVLDALLLLPIGFVAWWLADALTPLAFPTRVGIAAVTGTALIGFGVVAAVVGRLVLDRTERTTRGGVLVGVTALVVAAAGCVPLTVIAATPSVQTASGAGTYTPPAHLPTTVTWSTTSAFWGSSRTTAVLAHVAGDRCIVQGVDAGTGKQRWRWSAPTGQCPEPPNGEAALTAAGVVAIPVIDREFVLDVETGRQLWVDSSGSYDERRARYMDDSWAADTIAASSTLLVAGVALGHGQVEHRLVDPRSGHRLGSFTTEQVCAGPVPGYGTDGRGNAAVTGDTAVFRVVCDEDRSVLVLATAAGGPPTVVEAGREAQFTLAGDTAVVVDRPTDPEVRVRGVDVAAGTVRWTQTWTTTASGRDLWGDTVAAQLGDDVLVTLERDGAEATVVDARTGALTPYAPASDELAYPLPIGCTGTECWYDSGSTGVAGTGGQVIEADAGFFDIQLGPSVLAITRTVPKTNVGDTRDQAVGTTDVYA